MKCNCWYLQSGSECNKGKVYIFKRFKSKTNAVRYSSPLITMRSICIRKVRIWPILLTCHLVHSIYYSCRKAAKSSHRYPFKFLNKFSLRVFSPLFVFALSIHSSKQVYWNGHQTSQLKVNIAEYL